jgi:hypothetical protein
LLLENPIGRYMLLILLLHLPHGHPILRNLPRQEHPLLLHLPHLLIRQIIPRLQPAKFLPNPNQFPLQFPNPLHISHLILPQLLQFFIQHAGDFCGCGGGAEFRHEVFEFLLEMLLVGVVMELPVGFLQALPELLFFVCQYPLIETLQPAQILPEQSQLPLTILLLLEQPLNLRPRQLLSPPPLLRHPLRLPPHLLLLTPVSYMQPMTLILGLLSEPFLMD